jgi:hypothetical protein
MHAVIAKASPRPSTLLLPDVPALTFQGAQPFLLDRSAHHGLLARDDTGRCDNEVSPLRAARSQLKLKFRGALTVTPHPTTGESTRENLQRAFAVRHIHIRNGLGVAKKAQLHAVPFPIKYEQSCDAPAYIRPRR